jgi:hypothetical protein
MDEVTVTNVKTRGATSFATPYTTPLPIFKQVAFKLQIRLKVLNLDVTP